MKKKTETVAFKINQPKLNHWATTKLQFVRRDIDEFKKFGVTEEKLSSMEQMLKEFMQYPTDTEFLGDQMICTEARDAIALKLRIEMTAMLVRARCRFGIHSARFRRFGTARVSALSIVDLLLAARKIHRVAEMYQTELAEEGLTSEILSEFNMLVISFRDAIAAQEDAASNRIIATMERVKQANKLYNTTVTICYKGKRIWESKSEARYNDYVIYKNQSKKKKAGEEVPVTEPSKAEAIKPETGAIAIKEQDEQTSYNSYPEPFNIDDLSLHNKELGGGLKDDDAD